MPYSAEDLSSPDFLFPNWQIIHGPLFARVPRPTQTYIHFALKSLLNCRTLSANVNVFAEVIEHIHLSPV